MHDDRRSSEIIRESILAIAKARVEPAHALAHVAKAAPKLPKDHLLVMNLCGRGDKDIFSVAEHLGVKL